MADEPHATAVLARLSAHPSLTVYSEAVPENPPTSYVKVYVSIREPVADDLNFVPSEQSCWVYTHSASQTAAGARLTASFVRAQLSGFKPTVSGRVCWPIYWEDGNPPGRDESLGYPVVTQVDVWCFKTDAA